MNPVGYTKDFHAILDVFVVTSPIALTGLNVFLPYISVISFKKFFFIFTKKSEC